MSTINNTALTETTELVVKPMTKKTLANSIFQSKMTERNQSLFSSNKEFRAAVISAFQSDIGVSVASASTMYNQCKKDAEALGTVTLGRDPKKVKAPTTGKRGRPSGNHSKTHIKPDKVENDSAVDAQVCT